MTAITTSGGITIVAPQKSTGLRADVQYLEPYASSALNRKAYGIFGAGVYQGFSVTPGKGLAVIVSPNGTRPGVASVDVDGHQITVQLLTTQTVAVTAGKLNIVVLEAKYALGVATDQVDANSKIKAATLRVVNDEKSIVDGMIEICRLSLVANATSVAAASIDIDKRFSLRVSYEPTDDINDARENRLLTVKAGKSFVPLAGGTMIGALGTPRVVFPNDSKANASTDMDRADGFTVENLTAANKGYPVPGGLGTLMSAKVNEVRNVQLAFGSGNTAFYLRSLRKDDPTSDKWDRVYTQAFKPTAADVGALTDVQAAQKYALRSIKVNSKPLSADVNLVAGDVNAYTKTEGDGLYAAKARNLADLANKAEARTNLELGSSATRNAGKDSGNVMINGDFGVGGVAPILSSTNTLTIIKSLNTGKYAVNGDSTDMPSTALAYELDWSFTSTSSGGHGSLLVKPLISKGHANDRVYRNTLRRGVWQGWVGLYDTENKPTAADIGALTDAQAAQKYALRSIQVNGKPLSANVNLVAGDVNAWNKTEADGRFLMLSGGTVKNLTVKTGSTGTENTALLIDGVEHTPLVLKRASATANISIGFQLGGGKPLYRLGMDINNNLAWGTEANQTSNGVIYHTKNKPNAVDVGAVGITGSTMTGPLGTPRVVFPMDTVAVAADDANRADGFTVQQLTATNKGYPVSLGVLMTAKLSEFRNVQLAFGSGSTQFFLRSLRKGEAATEPWDRVYTQAFKPTAADVGALTDAQAAQKYALRSIQVNGKPLSANVNLVAGDVNAWNKTEADARYLMLSGGLVKGRAGFAGGLHLGNVNTLIEAGNDAAGYTSNNLMLKSWYGIGFANTCTTTGIQGVTGFINVRYGDLQMKRNITADAQIIEAGKRVYSPNNKPTAADVGALTDAQAAQKYALRSIQVNGKPLSANVNLVAGDVNAWNKTEADARFLLKTGGTLTGTVKTSAEIQSTTLNNYRIVSGDYGSFWRQDATALYLLLTAAKDQYGNYNSLRPMAVSVTTGAMTLGTQLTFSHNEWIRKLGINNYTSAGQNYNQTNGMILQGAGDQYAQTYFLETIGKHSALRWRVRSGGIDAWPEFRNDGTLQLSGRWPAIQNNTGTTWHPDGNIEGSCWGGYLSNWLSNNTVSRMSRGAQGSMTMDGGLVEAPAGCVLTGGNGNEGNQVGVALYRPLQIWRSGGWVTIEG
ncbi:phage tail fiber protein [Serratia silvae]|uniref:Long-tail fiber proximal subunit trimerization domain-containing protein n=1 Tax=Serratia silvae TaxID=2824122 RepID=A0ABT0KH61_9GAMM|nr:hypothetical protein [Serratia silvae]MCL1031373.1 hypothetical protein [Serratia silvae]